MHNGITAIHEAIDANPLIYIERFLRMILGIERILFFCIHIYWGKLSS